MSIIRLIHIKIDPSEKENAERIWKTECAPLMIQQKGCKHWIDARELRDDQLSDWTSGNLRAPRNFLK